jgi:hypothetical protein
MSKFSRNGMGVEGLVTVDGYKLILLLKKPNLVPVTVAMRREIANPGYRIFQKQVLVSVLFCRIFPQTRGCTLDFPPPAV